MPLEGKKIVLVITGSIAAYKSVFLCRLLVKSKAEVKVIMTPAALYFIAPLTFATLSKHPVISSLQDGDTWNDHVSLGLWADLMIFAPATANTLAHMAHGLCDNIADAVYLSARCPVFFAPAMDVDMWNHPATKKNIELLKSYGNHEITVNEGELASGLIGAGRMAEPEEILDRINHFFELKDLKLTTNLAGKTILITAGPTYENIDPVRFIGNHSTGKMGIELARELGKRNATVHLVLGPSNIDITNLTQNITVYPVTTAIEMLQQAENIAQIADIMIFAAAVADYRPETFSTQKIKKSDDTLTIELVKNPDIAKTLSNRKRKDQFTIGFALETNEEVKNANEKLQNKNLDLIVLNSLRDAGAGFGLHTNKIKIYSKNGLLIESPVLDKQEIAKIIVEEIEKQFQ
jgi:phosphopantothenoylcysteine decarboxylase/phosphopantothenate--cysteine ligase